MKALRKEKEILYINVITVLISIILTFITTYLLKNLFLSVFSITTVSYTHLVNISNFLEKPGVLNNPFFN